MWMIWARDLAWQTCLSLEKVVTTSINLFKILLLARYLFFFRQGIVEWAVLSLFLMISLCEVKPLFIYTGLIFAKHNGEVSDNFLSGDAIHLSWVFQRRLSAEVSNACFFLGNNLSGSSKRSRLLPIKTKSLTCMWEGCLYHSLPATNAFSFSFPWKIDASQIVRPSWLPLLSTLAWVPSEEHTS